MKLRKILAVFILGLMANIIVCSAHEEVSRYDHATYMAFLHEQANDMVYIQSTWEDQKDFVYGGYKPLTKEALDEAWERAQQLISEKNYRYACEIIEFLINDRTYPRSPQFSQSERASTTTRKGAWGEQDLSQLYDTLHEILPRAYENFNTFNFDVYEAFLRQYFLFNIKADDAVVVEALHKGELFVQQGFYKDAYRIFSLVLETLIKKDLPNNRNLLEKCYHLLKLIISSEIFIEDDFFVDGYRVRLLLSELVRKGEDPEKGLLLAQNLVEVALMAHGDFFSTALYALAAYSKEHNCTGGAIEYEKKLLQRILKEQPFFRDGKYRRCHDFARVLFLPVDYADVVIDSLIGLMENQSEAETKIALGKEFCGAFLLRACSDMRFVVDNQEKVASEIVRWAKHQLNKDFYRDRFCFDSEQNFEKFIKERQEDLDALKKGCFNRTFLLESFEKSVVVGICAAFAVKYAVWLQSVQKFEEARMVIQTTYKRLIQEKCLIAADILKKYVEACPQTEDLNNKFDDEYWLDVNCYSFDHKRIWLQPDTFLQPGR